MLLNLRAFHKHSSWQCWTVGYLLCLASFKTCFCCSTDMKLDNAVDFTRDHWHTAVYFTRVHRARMWWAHPSQSADSLLCIRTHRARGGRCYKPVVAPSAMDQE